METEKVVVLNFLSALITQLFGIKSLIKVAARIPTSSTGN
jgi:hypothetical protein